MLETIIKRDGSRQEFDASKLNKWSIWAARNIAERVDWSTVVMKTVKALGKEAESKVLNEELIRQLVRTKRWPEQLMAGGLYASDSRKEIFGNSTPTVRKLHQNLTALGLMDKMKYTDEDYMYVERIIDHSRDFNMAYFQVKQLRKKYAIKNEVKGVEYETPQFIFMRMTMALAENSKIEERLERIESLYNSFSLMRVNAPTPNYVNLGTKLKGFFSCCLYAVNDSIASLAAGDHIGYMMTAVSAGIGNIISTRSIGDPIRGGKIKHSGKYPYYRSQAAAVTANKQAGRSGADTTYVSIFDPEIEMIIMMQNPRIPADKRNRDIHFAVEHNKLFAKKVARNEDIFFFNCYTAPDLYEAQFSEDFEAFEALYNKYEQDPNFVKKYISARELIVLFRQQRNEVATLYGLQIDEVNRHTPHKDPIRSSNLCVAGETKILTDEGEVVISSKKNKKVNVWNGIEYSEVLVLQTNEDSELLHIYFNNGLSDDLIDFECTPYHKFYIKNDHTGDEEEIDARDLKPGMQIYPYCLPDNIGVSINVFVFDIVDDEKRGPTYCFNEPKRHRGVFNGILTGQCVEITQPTVPYDSVTQLYEARDQSMITFSSDNGLFHRYVLEGEKIYQTQRGDVRGCYLKEGDGIIKPYADIIGIDLIVISKLLDYKCNPEVSTCSLSGIVISNIENDEQYEQAAYDALVMIDECTHKSELPLPHVQWTALQRLNAGVGILGLAHHMARLNLKWNTPEGLKEIDKVFERHAYFCIKASLRLGQERGNAPWMHRTKWPEGWLPIDTYKKSVDELVPFEQRYDWEGLRADIIANGGIRNSSVIAMMPTESSSKASGAPNGPYPIRDLDLKKSDSSNILDWCAPDNDILADQYQLAWELTTIEQIKCYAVMQKWIDQSISADLYRDRTMTCVNEQGEVIPVPITDDELIKEHLAIIKYGVKSEYYMNSFTGGMTNKDDDKPNAPEEVFMESTEPGCDGGFCTL